MLSSVPRTLLRDASRSMRNLSIRADQFSHPGRNRDWVGWRAAASLVSAAVVAPSAFEAFLDDVDKAVHAAYADLPDAARVTAERQVQWSARVPEALRPAVTHLLGPGARNLVSRVAKAAELWGCDCAWLGLSEDDVRAGRRRGAPYVDAVRKVPLVPTDAFGGGGAAWSTAVAATAPGARARRLRRCVRCGAFMEDIHPKEKHPLWLMSMHKECPCSGAWVLVDV